MLMPIIACDHAQLPRKPAETENQGTHAFPIGSVPRPSSLAFWLIPGTIPMPVLTLTGRYNDLALSPGFSVCQ